MLISNDFSATRIYEGGSYNVQVYFVIFGQIAIYDIVKYLINRQGLNSFLFLVLLV